MLSPPVVIHSLIHSFILQHSLSTCYMLGPVIGASVTKMITTQAHPLGALGVTQPGSHMR